MNVKINLPFSQQIN